MMDSIRSKRRPRATLADVAAAAGVGIATVDRVLNRRAPVKAETARRVQEAAAAIGFHAADLFGRRVAEIKPERRLGFLLQRRADHFYRHVAAELARATRGFGLGGHKAVVEHMEDLTPARIADHLARMEGRCDALALVAADHPKVNAAIDRLARAGVPVYALLSDLTAPARAGFFGIDHRKAGRTAGWAISRLARAPGTLGIVVGNHRYLGHEICEAGFRSYIREHAPSFRLLDSFASFEDKRVAHEATLDLMRRHPDLRGLYVAGGGIEGIIEALRERARPDPITVVCNELIPETRLALVDGIVDLVIATPVRQLAGRAVGAMMARLDGREAPPAEALAFELHVEENI